VRGLNKFAGAVAFVVWRRSDGIVDSQCNKGSWRKTTASAIAKTRRDRIEENSLGGNSQFVMPA